jgi:hypothetical protein
MAGDDRDGDTRVVAFDYVAVGAADAGGTDAEAGFARGDLGFGEFFPLDVTELFDDPGVRHVLSFVGGRPWALRQFSGRRRTWQPE